MGGDGGKLRLIEQSRIISAPIFRRTHLEDDIAPAFKVIRRKAALAGVVVGAGLGGRGQDRP